MWGVDKEKEATLKEVLAEVSLLDLGRMIKEVLLSIGCLAVFWGIIFFASAAITGTTGLRFSHLGIPDWVFWLAFAWMMVASATTERSFYEVKISWFFPRLNWFTSFLLAGYIVGFFQLMTWVNSLEKGLESGLAFAAVWFGYLTPFLLFLSAINVGYSKLMEKRQQARGEERRTAAD